MGQELHQASKLGPKDNTASKSSQVTYTSITPKDNTAPESSQVTYTSITLISVAGLGSAVSATGLGSAISAASR
jgi:hypothetical protein